MDVSDYSDSSVFDKWQIVTAAGVSVLVSAISFLTFTYPWRSIHPTKAGLGWTVGSSLGIFLGSIVIGVELVWPPQSNQQRLLLVALPFASLVELMGCFQAIPRFLIWSLRWLLACSLPTVLLFGTIYLEDFGMGLRRWNDFERMIWLSFLALGMIGIWAGLSHRAEKSSNRIPPLILICLGSAVAVMLSGYAGAGLLFVPLTVTLVTLWIASRLVSDADHAGGALNLGWVGLFSLIGIGHFFGTLSLVHALILWMLPLVCLYADITWVKRQNPWIRHAVPMGIILVFLAGILQQARQEFLIASSRPSPHSTSPGTPSYLDTMSQEEVVQEYQQFMKRNQPVDKNDSKPSLVDPFENFP